MIAVKCTKTVELAGKVFATEGKAYKLLERKRHPGATHGHVVIKGDDGKLHTLPDTYFANMWL